MANTKDLLNIEQKFFRYELWEDYQSGMYNPPNASTEKRGIEKAIECLSDPAICRKHMEMVVSQWGIATTEVLTNPETNGRAWLGQCACFMYAGCHDEETRKAWVMLEPSTQKTANKIAEEVIYNWLAEYSKQCPNYQMNIFDIGDFV